MRELQSRVKKKSEESDDNQETTKAAAWAVFQHRNGGGGSNHLVHGAGVQRATRFKIEAQMKHELERRRCAMVAEDVESTLFDSYEVDSVFKHLDRAFQSVDIQQSRVSFEAPREHDEQRTSKPSSTVDNLQQRCRGNWLEHADDESLPLAAHEDAGWCRQDVSGNRHEAPNPKLVLDMDLYEDICKGAQEAVPQGKLLKMLQFLHTPNRWNVMLQRQRSFIDHTTPEDVLLKDNKQQRKWKLQNMFRSKLPRKDHGSLRYSCMRQARIVPDDSSQKGQQNPPRRSAELVYKNARDSDRGDPNTGGQHHEHVKCAAAPGTKVRHQLPQPALKSGLQMVLVPPFCRTVRLSSDMSNPDADEGLRDHLRHGELTYGPPPRPQTGRRRSTSSYSLNIVAAASPVQHPRRSKLQDLDDDLELDNSHRFHHEHRHHYHHVGHHHQHSNQQDVDYELTVQDIVRRLPRKSFVENAHRLLIQENTGLRTPRNSLEIPFFLPG